MYVHTYEGRVQIPCTKHSVVRYLCMVSVGSRMYVVCTYGTYAGSMEAECRDSKK